MVQKAVIGAQIYLQFENFFFYKFVLSVCKDNHFSGNFNTFSNDDQVHQKELKNMTNTKHILST